MSVPKLILFFSCFLAATLLFGQSTRPDNRALDSIYHLTKFGRFSLLNSNQFIGGLSPASKAKYFNRPVPVFGSTPARPQNSCFDTSGVFYLQNDTLPYYSGYPILSKDQAHIIVAGGIGDFLPSGGFVAKGFLMKTDLYGNVDWVQRFDSVNNQSPALDFSYLKTLELNNGELLLVGRAHRPNYKSDDILITKTTAAGVPVWTKVYECRLWLGGNGSGDYWGLHEIKQDPQGSEVYISAGIWSLGKTLLKLDPSNGNIIWGRQYQPPFSVYSEDPLGLFIEGNELKYFGQIGSSIGGLIAAYRIQKQTGDALETKFFQPNEAAGYQTGFATSGNSVFLNNGRYGLVGECRGSLTSWFPPGSELMFGAAVEFDANLNFSGGYGFTNTRFNSNYNNEFSLQPDGSGLLFVDYPLSGYSNEQAFVQFRKSAIVKQRLRYTTGQGYPFHTPALRYPGGSDVIVRQHGDSAGNWINTEYLRLHVSDTSSLCLGNDITSFRSRPVFYDPLQGIVLDSVPVDVYRVRDVKTYTAIPANKKIIQGCSIVSYCDSLKLNIARPTICLGQPLTVKIYKNKACGSQVPLIFDTSAVQQETKLNDSTVVLQFKKSWSGYISAELMGCTLMKDSVFVRVLQAQATINLGTDTFLCAGNSKTLNAGSGFATYTWQDGSTDSTFTVSTPGTYYVTATDACGGSFSDTIKFYAAPPLAFSVGADRTKCAGDTIMFTAPSGFFNYQWSNNYFISSTTSQNVTVNPLIDTTYFVSAEKSPGCFAYDTVKVKLLPPPVVHLGNDTSFCKGDSLQINAGPLMLRYQWSTGDTTQFIVAKTAATYSVRVTSVNGCNGSDTLVVRNVYPLPVVSLEQNISLCVRQTKMLDAGIAASYKWNTSETGRQIQVNKIGKYTVSVVDINGCKAGDSTAVIAINNLPSGFLSFGDTAVCSYSSILLTAATGYQSFLWSTGETTSTITADQPGRYWLQVKDNKNCTGYDTINITQKSCMEGVYLPKAFSPNLDGKNDVFKPLIFGNVQGYEFKIFNRYGKIVFSSTKPGQGWDGTVKGQRQNAGAFVWTCTYQLEGRLRRAVHGTVMLMR